MPAVDVAGRGPAGIIAALETVSDIRGYRAGFGQSVFGAPRSKNWPVPEVIVPRCRRPDK